MARLPGALLTLIGFTFAGVATPGLAAPGQSPIERGVLAELNALRQNPKAYIPTLDRYRQYFRANLVVDPSARFNLMTEEGVRPVNEAMGYLAAQHERQTLEPAEILTEAAADLVDTQSQSGEVGHVLSSGSDPSARVQNRNGGPYVSEVIAYGATDAKGVILQLLVDDGVPDRGHRTALFDSRIRFAGVSCGLHPIYRTMCVIDFAETPSGRSGPEQRDRLLHLAALTN